MNTKKIISITTGIAIAASMALAIPALAQTNAVNAQSNKNPQPGSGWQNQGHMNGPSGANHSQRTMKPGVSGTVTAVNGDSITINGKQGFASTTSTVSYTIDATNATVKKNNATSTVSSIAVGDTIMAQGTVTGTNVTATNIIDGVMNRGTGNRQGSSMNGRPGTASSTQVIGNGQPVVAGTVSTVNGYALTVTTASNVTYTIDATNAKVLQGQSTVAFSSIVVGEKVLIQGTVNGTSITASTIVDQSASMNNNASTTGASNKGQEHGIFTSIGQFFMRLFGF